MKLALVGHGKMGRLVEEVAAERGLDVVDRFTRQRPLARAARGELGEETVLIDFSVADAVLDTVRAAAERGLNLVIGTTGWQERLEEARRVVDDAGTGLVHGANFSLGTNLFFRVVDYAARTFAAFDAYDPYIRESHHRLKKDSPSGTALVLERTLARHYAEREVPVASLRAGHIPGTHEVGFDSVADSLHLEHRARSRHGFAEGAVLAARWIAGRRGFHTFQHLLDEVYPPAPVREGGRDGRN